jgi:hypothetical protein
MSSRHPPHLFDVGRRNTEELSSLIQMRFTGHRLTSTSLHAEIVQGHGPRGCRVTERIALHCRLNFLHLQDDEYVCTSAPTATVDASKVRRDQHESNDGLLS